MIDGWWSRRTVYGSGFALFLLIAWVVHGSYIDPVRRQATVAIAAGIALIDGFIAITTIMRHLFHGPDISLVRGFEGMSDAELYCYTAAWLIYGGAMVVFAIWRRLRALRYAAVAIVVLVVAKVLIIDTSHLTTLYRVASLLVIGFALLGLGYLYQRMLKRMEA